MAKRFTDTGKWCDNWYCELTNEFKLVYLYVIDNCDAVGVWKPNYKLAEFQLGFKVKWEDFIKAMGQDRLVITEKFWWLRKFCDFQYGTLSEESKSKTTAHYIKLLKSHSLWIAYTKGMYSPKEKEKEKEQEKEIDYKALLEEIKLKMIDDYILSENVCRNRGFSKGQYDFAVSDFLGTLPEPELEKEYSELGRHFGNWCRQNERTILNKQVKPAKTAAKDDDWY